MLVASPTSLIVVPDQFNLCDFFLARNAINPHNPAAVIIKIHVGQARIVSPRN
jgi:hypothetical protein